MMASSRMGLPRSIWACAPCDAASAAQRIYRSHSEEKVRARSRSALGEDAPVEVE